MYNHRERESMARLAIYLRRSSPGEEDKNYSLGSQQEDIEKRWPEFPQHEVVKTYSDPGGKSYTLNRPVLQHLMADAKAGLFDIVIVGRWDRFSRMQDQQAVAIYQLQQYKVKVLSATQPVPDGPIGTLIRGNYAFAAELELQNIRERTYAGKKARVHDNKLPPKPYPLYGYLFDSWEKKERYIVDPETSHVVARIYALCLSGMPTKQIARALDAEHVPTPRAVLEARGQLPKNWKVLPKWSPSTINRILTHPGYCGRLVGWGTLTTTAERVHIVTGDIEIKRVQLQRPVNDPDRVVFDESVCPAIVTPEAWVATQEQLTINAQQAPRRLRDPEAMLLRNGFAICAVCQRQLQGAWHEPSQRWRYNCHKKHVSRYAEDLDAFVWNWVLFQFEHPDVLRKKYEQWVNERNIGVSLEQDRLAALKMAFDVDEKRRKNYMRLAGVEDDVAQAEEYRLLAKEAAESVRNLAGQIEELQTLINQADQREEVFESMVAAAERKSTNLRNADFHSKRQLLYFFQVKAIVHRADEQKDPDIAWELDNQHARWFPADADDLLSQPQMAEYPVR